MKTIVYAGVDSRFADEIQTYFKKLYPGISIIFYKVFDPDSVGKMQEAILNFSPDLLYIDFSFKTQIMLNLANFVCRDEGLSKVSIVGLFDFEIDKDVMFNSFSLGVTINHIKSIEVQDVVHHGVVKAFPEAAKTLDVLRVTTNSEIELKCALPIGFITSDYIHVESNIRFDLGSKVHLEVNKFSDLNLINEYQVERSSDTNLYTHNQLWHDFKFEFLENHKIEELKLKIDLAKKQMLDKVIPILEKELKNSIIEEQHLASNRKKDIQHWLEEHEKDGHAKTSRIVVVDHRVDLMSEAIIRFEHKPYSIRYYTNVENTLEKVMKTMPGIIFYSLDYPDNTDHYLYDDEERERKELQNQLQKLAEAWEKTEHGSNLKALSEVNTSPSVTPRFNTLDTFAKLIQKIKVIPDYNPIIVINNCHEKKELLDKELGHDHYLIDAEMLTLEKIEQLGDKYVSSDGSLKTHNPQKRFHHKEKRVYIDKYDEKRFANFSFSAELLSISESEIYFASKLDILPTTCLRISNPVDMFITVLPLPQKELHFDRPPLKNVYFGLIWGLDEKGKSSLRRFTNKLLT